MSWYRRLKIEGGVFFFTVALADRTDDLLVRQVDRLRRMYQAVHARHPFETIAICILPDHIHAVWSLPTGDTDYARRWSLIKSRFSRGLPYDASRTRRRSGSARKACGSAAIGNTRFAMTQTSRATLTTFHFNPVKHGYVSRVCDWPHSSFHRYVAKGDLSPDWGGDVKASEAEFGE